MKFICAPRGFDTSPYGVALRVVLYGQGKPGQDASAGEAVRQTIKRKGLVPSARAWDFLTIALSALVADGAALRSESPDGWTRELNLTIAVLDPVFWQGQAGNITEALAYLTTDRWSLHFIAGGEPVPSPRKQRMPDEDAVVLLSGGLDSLVGAIDVAANGRKALAVSKVVRGDGAKQVHFAQRLKLDHLPLNDNAKTPRKAEDSQRARSLIFIAFGILAATTLRPHKEGELVPLYLCENGFIAVNASLTGSRLGSLSTRTAQPAFLALLQRVLDAADMRVKITNPYRHQTKGEMLKGCLNQEILRNEAVSSTSCGRYQRLNYHHCGRCVPCQVRRASLLAWGEVDDSTGYKFDNLGMKDAQHAEFDDVRAVAMAVANAKAGGIDRWVGNALASPLIEDRPALRDMLERGLAELEQLHKHFSVS